MKGEITYSLLFDLLDDLGFCSLQSHCMGIHRPFNHINDMGIEVNISNNVCLALVD